MKPFDGPRALGQSAAAVRENTVPRKTTALSKSTAHRLRGWIRAVVLRSFLVCLAMAAAQPSVAQYGSAMPPSGGVLGFQHDTTGRLTQLNWNGNPLVTNITWNPMGQPTGWTWAFVTPGLTASRTYDTAAHLTATEFSKYFYDAAGRISAVAQDLLKPADADPTQSTLVGYVSLWTVAYDPVGRITGFNSNTDKSGFSYDANGNRTSSTRTINGQTTSRSYTVDGPSNRLLGFTQSIGAARTNVAYGYNANGDLTSDGLRTFSYNAEGRLSAVTTGATDASPTTRYVHNALGQRVFKTEPLFPPAAGDESNAGFMQSLIAFFNRLWAPSTSDAEKLGFAFMYDEEGNLISETGTGGANSTGSTQYIYLPTATGAMPIAVIVNGQMFAVHSDHLNTPRRITNSRRQVVWQWSYSAFGEDEPTIAAQRFTNANTVPTNGATGISPITFNLRYWGMYKDNESGLFYNGFRSYDPRTGRYTQNDPIGLAGGSNRKTGLENDPLGFGDPNGLQVRGIRNPSSLLESGGAGPANGGGGGLTAGMIGAGAGAWIGTNITAPMWAKAPENAYDPLGPKAPGRPGDAEGFNDPKGGENWVRNPNPGRGGSSHGWEDDLGRVWCPTGQGGRAHGGPHWDVELPNGKHVNVPPGQNINDVLR